MSGATAGACLFGCVSDLCPCVPCVRARQHDRRDAKLMLRASRLRCAGVPPAERVEWDLYIAERNERGEYLPDAARRV